jgi:hypothetical protein
MRVVATLRKEKEEHLMRWRLPEILAAAQDRVTKALHKYLPTKVTLATPAMYDGQWTNYARAFFRVGGVIEACPDVILSSPSSNLFIHPDGTVALLSTHDQILSSPFVYAGCTFPSSAPADLLHPAALTAARACYREGIIGYIGIDFVLYLDTHTQHAKLCAVDLNLRLTASQCSFALFHFLMRGKYHSVYGRDRSQPLTYNRCRYTVRGDQSLSQPPTPPLRLGGLLFGGTGGTPAPNSAVGTSSLPTIPGAAVMTSAGSGRPLSSGRSRGSAASTARSGMESKHKRTESTDSKGDAIVAPPGFVYDEDLPQPVAGFAAVGASERPSGSDSKRLPPNNRPLSARSTTTSITEGGLSTLGGGGIGNGSQASGMMFGPLSATSSSSKPSSNDEERSYASISYIYQPQLSTLPFGSFFHLCRLRSIFFDLRARTGTAFMLMDSLASATLGLLCVATTSHASARSLTDALTFLEEQAQSTMRIGPVHVYDSESNLKACMIASKAILRAKTNATGGATTNNGSGGITPQSQLS